jgi:filamentous hemagglutinin family protein
MALTRASLVLSLLLAVGHAQVKSTITPDSTLGTAVTQKGNIYTITGGTRPGNGPNLFHSFDRFSVGQGDTASFTSEQTGIKHILSRVTGGQRSDIDGQLRTDGQLQAAGANLYLLNPSGVLFGPNATLDVSGSFHVSTADYLRLADGARFYARLSETSTLSVAPPVAFGFLGPQPAAITVQGSSLRVPAGATLSAVGGDIRITGREPLRTEGALRTLRAMGGEIQLASIAAAGEVPVNLEDFPGTAGVRLGWVEISQGYLDASGNGGGAVRIRGGQLRVDGSWLRADNIDSREGMGLGIDLRITDEVVVTHGSFITANSQGAGRARDLQLTAGSVQLEQAAISSNTGGAGAAGAVTVKAGRMTLREGGTIASNVLEGGTGPGGSVTIKAGVLEIDGGLIQAQSAAGSTGSAGTVTVTAERITLTGGAQISSSTRGTGQAGTVTVHATEALTITGQDGPDEPSGLLSSTTGPGAAGAVVVEAGQIIMREGGAIASDAFSVGQGGRVTVNTTTLEMAGGLIEAQTAQGSKGDAGAIAVMARNITLSGGARINSTTLGAGRGGSITVTTTDAVAISGHTSGLFTNTAGQGLGGDIAVQAHQIQLTNGAVIAAASTGTGKAGSLTLMAGDTLLLRGGSAVTSAASQATGGHIRVTAASLVRLQDSQITATVGGGTGDGGNVTIDPAFIVLQGSQITANAVAGHGGRITLTASKAFLADPSSVVTASSTLGINGEVNIQAPVTQISGSLTPLPQAFARPATLLSTRCAARLQEGTLSTLVMRGRDGVPAHPDGVSPLPLALAPPEAAEAGGTAGPPEDTAASRVGVLHLDDRGQAQVRGWPGQGVVPAVLALECAK